MGRGDGSDDCTLMASVMRGDREALATLVARHQGPILGYLYRLTNGDRPLAEDLAQETFLRLLREPSYQPERPFKPWLYAIATHLARDHFRSAAVRHATTPAHAAALLALHDAAPGPEEQALATDGARAVAEAVGQLPEEYRVALLLRFYQGLSLGEIAEVLDVPLGTVKSRLSVGTRRLRDLLRPAREGAPR